MGHTISTGSYYDELTSYDPKQAQKLEDTVNDLTHFFKRFSDTIPTEKFSNFLLNSMLIYQKRSLRSRLGFEPSLRTCLIKASKELTDYAWKTQEFSANWNGIRENVYEIIDKNF